MTGAGVAVASTTTGLVVPFSCSSRGLTPMPAWLYAPLPAMAPCNTTTTTRHVGPWSGQAWALRNSRENRKCAHRLATPIEGPKTNGCGARDEIAARETNSREFAAREAPALSDRANKPWWGGGGGGARTRAAGSEALPYGLAQKSS